jgi:lysozyme
MRTRTIATGLTIAVLALFEGYRQVDYHDPVGIPTACFGHTETAAIGTQRDVYGCEDLLLEDVRDRQAMVLRHTTVPLNDNQLAALTSFVYNVGENAYRQSTLLKKLNAGDYEGACRELPRWVYAKGVKLSGLVRRRDQEMKLCLATPLFGQ